MKNIPNMKYNGKIYDNFRSPDFLRNSAIGEQVDPKFTSQKCSCCGHVSKENRKTQAEFVCVSCGFSANADYNASLNILAAGTVVKAS